MTQIQKNHRIRDSSELLNEKPPQAVFFRPTTPIPPICGRESGPLMRSLARGPTHFLRRR